MMMMIMTAFLRITILLRSSRLTVSVAGDCGAGDSKQSFCCRWFETKLLLQVIRNKAFVAGDSKQIVVVFYSTFWTYQPKWCTYSAVWFFHGWCHVNGINSLSATGLKALTQIASPARLVQCLFISVLSHHQHTSVLIIKSLVLTASLARFRQSECVFISVLSHHQHTSMLYVVKSVL